jgi:hypothetical protein
MRNCPYCGTEILFEEKMGKFVVRASDKWESRLVAIQDVQSHMDGDTRVIQAKCVEFVPVPGIPHVTRAENIEYITFDWGGRDIFAPTPTPKPGKEERDMCIVLAVITLLGGAVLWFLRWWLLP